MIPLIRPIFPSTKRARGHFSGALSSGQLANFGTCHLQLCQRLSAIAAGPALPVTSGTAAIEVALRMLGLEPGARVLLPDFTHSGTLLAVIRAGMTPVFAGVDWRTWTIRQDEVEKAIKHDQIEAAIVVSPFGYDIDYRAWEALAARCSCPLVYDLAGGWGNFFPSRWPRCYSFHATKSLGIGEGGFVVLTSFDDRDRAQRLVNFDTQSDRTIGSLNGFNAKMDELHCAYVLAAIDGQHRIRVNQRIAHRRALLSLYSQLLPSTYVPPGEKNPSLCVLGNLPAAELEAGSDVTGATFKRYYPLLSRMPACSGIDRLSVSDDTMTTCCALPSDATLDEAMTVIEIVRRYL